MLAKRPFKAPIIIYLISRFSCLGTLVIGFFRLGPGKLTINCHVAAIFQAIFFSLVVSSTHALLYLRVRAIYVGHRMVRVVLLILWLAVVGASFTVFVIWDFIPSPDEAEIRCIPIAKHLNTTGTAGVITAMVHNTAVFAAISWQMYRFIRVSESDNHKTMNLFIPVPTEKCPLWKCILQDGQLYYLLSLFWELIETILMVTSSLNLYYRTFLLPVHITIINSLACHVFRNVRLGKFREEAFSSVNQTQSAMSFAPNISNSTSLALSEIQSHSSGSAIGPQP
ncbi:hypothetical protein K435DRAFT_972228 [Dendrothele bispora CBS 962.96]|uniref:G-protein coupled receptors family 1 profile domain-containing protein n=1 Tax=Dendrothele bispora (strain CBS 962.96) TaxID=1314807 RepID=A0A4S8L0G1_DENBC|nr:hypothetical protein K435DRAFT_972228 [Dendrothele bispora CBS 962.96]